MLEQLFGSKTRVRLLRLFLHRQKECFFVREMTRRIGAQINAVRNELENLVALGLIVECEAPVPAADAPKGSAASRASSKRKKFYRLNTECVIFGELRTLFVKARAMLEKDFVGKLAATGGVTYLALTGQLVGLEAAPTDMLIVSRANKEKILGIIRAFERELGVDIAYTLLTPQEYKYRCDVTDRFLYSILESKKIVVLDRQAAKVGLPV